MTSRLNRRTWHRKNLLRLQSRVSIAEAEFKSGTIGRVFTSGLIDGERRFIEWRREGEEKLRAERKPERLPAVLIAAEQVGQSLAAYGSANAVGGTQ